MADPTWSTPSDYGRFEPPASSPPPTSSSVAVAPPVFRQLRGARAFTDAIGSPPTTGDVYSVYDYRKPYAGGAAAGGGGGGRSMPTASPNASSTHSSNHSSAGGSEQLSKTNLYIRGLTQNTTDKDLENLCKQYGKIISTKAIIDQTTNKCKGYGFVDFDSLQAAEIAVRALQQQGVQAQMAKVSIVPLLCICNCAQQHHVSVSQQQEQDPTNLYIANLPVYMTETNLEEMFSPFGQVISTRILRDNQGHSRGVGFARMESKDKCEQIIQTFNGQKIPGHMEPLTVKLADSGNKRRNQQQRPWIDRQQGDMFQLTGLSAYDQANGGVTPQGMTPPSIMPRYATHTPVTSYQIQGGANWLTQPPAPYIMQHMPQQVIPTSVHPGSHLDHSGGMPQLAAQMSSLQLSTGTSVGDEHTSTL
ncbi:hypothetical protein CAPTEDRAFT_154976 [Capitella teleta]|uniref:RRM domain-containing protein n=1 Tax=Capitella teleta TaxID=283909 RepID=R7UA17_CAPTE|nr:hypothetical protein CAPTEDRAFT_154976 [Capitella teleta]|eukprot:ELU02931.1 hypothetical protein CAPTEDRAFT_154976 [Capitella teleta]